MTDQTTWRHVVASSDRYGSAPWPTTRVREVTLWGRPVWINDEHEVFCRCHLEFQPIDELQRLNNGHVEAAPGTRTSQPMPMVDA